MALRVLHIIPSLNRGGAEHALVRLARATQGTSLENSIACLIEPGSLADEATTAGIDVHSLGMSRTRPSPTAAFSLRKLIRRTRPDVIQTWMYHADLIGSLTALGTSKPVIWNLRQTDLTSSLNRRRTLQIIALCAKLSHYLPTRIVAGSDAAQRVHAERGFDSRKMCVIPNGFDTSTLKPDPAARHRLIAHTGASADSILIGYAARLHPHKGHSALIEAFERIRDQRPEVELVLMGHGTESENPFWRDLRIDLRRKIHLMGEQRDPHALVSGLDLFVSPSVSEGFPNALAEAMACGVPCVATEVGDSAVLVGDTGRTVPARDPIALAEGILEMLALPTAQLQALGRRARERIQVGYSSERACRAYEALYKEVASCAG